ncbi:hypothetical protein V8G54_019246 [Vigna mungo]|uniref:Uncharacterized protein n=1 Tax=Vigna mungo TaxID=3915 RepID=A0AAQ3NA93_VIGMU
MEITSIPFTRTSHIEVQLQKNTSHTVNPASSTNNLEKEKSFPSSTNYDVGSTSRVDLKLAPLLGAMKDWLQEEHKIVKVNLWNSKIITLFTTTPSTTNYDVGSTSRVDLRTAPLLGAMKVTGLGHDAVERNTFLLVERRFLFRVRQQQRSIRDEGVGFKEGFLPTSRDLGCCREEEEF